MITERFITFLKANLTDFLDKLDQFEQRYKHSPNAWSIEQFLEEIFSNPSQRRQFEDAYERYQNLYGDEQKSSYQRDTRGDNPFDKFEYYYNKYEQSFEQQDQQYQNYYQRRKQQQSYSRTQSQKVNEDMKHYDALEIDPGASYEEIKKAYKKAMMKYHPDKFAGDAEKQKYAQQLSQKINEAHEYFKKKFGK